MRMRVLATLLGVAALVTACADPPQRPQNDARLATVAHSAGRSGIGVTSVNVSHALRSDERLWALAVQQAGSAQNVLRAAAVRSDRTTANRVLMDAGVTYEHGVVDN